MQKTFIFILISVVTLNSCDVTTAEEYYNQAFEYEEKGDLQKAIKALDDAIDKQSNFQSALINRGYYKTEMGNLEDGISDYQKILEINPNNTTALYNIGINYQEMEKFKDATEYFTRALNTEGALYILSNNPELGFSVKYDQNKLDADANFGMLRSEIQFSRGVNYFMSKNYDNALVDFENIIEDNYEKAISYLFVGEIYLEKENRTKACENLSLAANMGVLEAKTKLKEYCKDE